MIDEVNYHLVARTLIIQFKDILMKHFSLHQSSVTTCGKCEAVVHIIWMMLNLHPDWVVL